MEDRIGKLNGRLSQLLNERQSFYSHWQELSEYCQPRASRFISQKVNDGQKKHDKIIDATQVVALRTLASGMMAGLTSPARPWFRLTTGDGSGMDSTAVKAWLYELESRVRFVFSKSNLYNTLPVAYINLGLFGTSAFLVLEDDDDVIRCHPVPIGSYCLAANHRNSINTMYREYSMSVAQIVDQFGLANCSDTVKSAWENKAFDNWIEVCHAIQPRKLYNKNKGDNKNMPFESVWWEKGERSKFLRESGFKTFPVMAARWSATGEDIYGSSPGMDALADIKMLQLMQKRKMQAIDKLVNPPMLADASLRSSRTSLLPGDVTYVSGLQNSAGAGFRPVYEINPRIAELSAEIDTVQQRVRRIFFEDLMLMLATGDSSQMTAREVEERHQEKLLVLGPVMERLNDELLSPLIERTIDLMTERGLMPEPPPELEGKELQIEYISIMSQAQKLIGTASIERLVAFVGNLAGAKPDVLDKVNFDQAIDEYGDMLGVPPKVIKGEDEVMKERQARAQAAQQQQMLASMPGLQQGADAARLLSETDVGGASALQRMMGAA